MGQPQGEKEGWDMENRIMTRGTEGVERWGVGVKVEGRGLWSVVQLYCMLFLSTSVAMGF